MKIGEVARRSLVPAKTIRYYESVGLIRAATRADNGYRNYDDNDVRTLCFIQRARSLGFPMDEVAELLPLWQDRSRASADVRAIALRHVDAVERRIRELQSVRDALLDLVHRCHGDERPECPIIDTLACSADPLASSRGTTAKAGADGDAGTPAAAPPAD